MSTPELKAAKQAAIDAFHAHCDVCKGCASGPFSTCAKGVKLLEAANAAIAAASPGLGAGLRG